MKQEFPIFKTKTPPGSPKFDLADPEARASYFKYKAGPEIAKIKQYLQDRTFVALLLGKKGSGKGTYSKLFAEALESDNVVHLSVGDLVRSVDEEVQNPQKREELVSYLKANYRGFLPIEKLIQAQLERSTTKLLPTEFILVLLKRAIAQLGKKVIFIDGFPREMDQVSYSLFFRDLIGYRDDPDFFILIDVPTNVIDERIKYRVVCPKCQTSRSIKLLITKNIGYDEKNKEFFLRCDNPGCKGTRMVAKEGDNLGIAPIAGRLKKDDELIDHAFSLYGIPKILLRNAFPAEEVKEVADDYEVTPQYVLSWDEKKKKVDVKEKPWIIKDDNGKSSYSLLAPPVVVSLIKQLADLLP